MRHSVRNVIAFVCAALFVSVVMLAIQGGVAWAADGPTITITYNYTDDANYNCTFFAVSSNDSSSSGYAFCADHDKSPYIEGQTLYSGGRPTQCGFSTKQERMFDYVLYYGYGGKEPQWGYLQTTRVTWEIVHGYHYRGEEDYDSERLWDAAEAYANAGGGGKPAGCAYYYPNPSGMQPVVHAKFAKSGSVKVQKVRDGGHDDTFTFRIVVKEGSNTVKDETFTLTGGASKTFTDLPAGSTYEVTETGGAEHYDATWENRTGTVVEDTTATVTCTNKSHGYMNLHKDVAI